MNENIENKVELFRQFLFHYGNWVEAWISEYPANVFESQAAHSAAFETANRNKLRSMYVKYNLSPEKTGFFENFLKPTENGRKCIEKSR